METMSCLGKEGGACKGLGNSLTHGSSKGQGNLAAS